ncbi:MAG: hypothetical protein OJF49_000882 [Ktedonobacterales bacterium]|nr:MAG: hypothetical protein OJF49_000882 [Ktedonobacterales bacterium]
MYRAHDEWVIGIATLYHSSAPQSHSQTTPPSGDLATQSAAHA